jgi:hypothetical protein
MWLRARFASSTAKPLSLAENKKLIIKPIFHLVPMDLKWPQPGNYRPNLEILSSSYSRLTKPKPLDPKYYTRYQAFNAAQELIEQQLTVAAAKVAKAEADLTVADNAVNKWSKAAAKITNAQRLKNVLAEVKAAEAVIRAKLDFNAKENSALTEIIRLQESMEQSYNDSISRPC